MSSTGKGYDLMFITDATGSMGAFLSDLKNALPQIFDLVQLTDLVDRVSVLAYRDYCDTKLIEWSGWTEVQEADTLTSFVKKLKADGGGDTPEALKTGLWEACKKVEKPTICILYLDAPPHHKFADENAGENYKKEVEALGEENSQWVKLCFHVHDHQMRVYPMFPKLSNYMNPFFVSLADITDGQCFEITTSNIVKTTIGILLNLAGVEFEHAVTTKSLKMPESFKLSKFLSKDANKYTQPPLQISPKIKAIAEIKARIGDPVKRFRSSEDYQKLVFAVFQRIMTPERVMAFTYNTIFGKLWRAICAERKDPRRENLVVKLSGAVTSVPDADRELLQSFLDETYDQTEAIEEIIRSCGDAGPFYVIDREENLTRKMIYEIGFSCAPFALTAVLKMLQGLRISNKVPDKTSNLTYIPVNLEPSMKFKLLPHLMCPGIMFTSRLSAIIATVSKISGSILKDDAVKTLNESRGKWIDFSLPENNSMDFARLMMKVADDALTEEETKYLRAVIMVGSLKKSKKRDLEVEIAYSSYKSKRPDIKDRCKKCKQMRSMTLLLDETCAICIVYPEECTIPESDESTSYMCECRKCLVHYAVYKVENLKCKAKCHFCREDQIAPYVECNECSNKFLYQQSKPLENFTCAVCKVKGARVGEMKTVTVKNYIAQNGAGFIGMKVEDLERFFDDANKVSKTTPEERLLAVRNFAEITEKDFAGHKFAIGELFKDVWNVKELQAQVFDIFKRPKMNQCMICFEDFPEQKLSTICGRKKKGCSVESCKACLTTWYNQLSPGNVCQPAQLVCPYCKNVPLLKIIRQYNEVLCTLMNETDVDAFDPSFIHAWCTECYKIKEAMRRECGGENPEIVRFKCDDCNVPELEPETESGKVRFQECPQCGVMTEKTSGCNHIACEAEIGSKKEKKICNTHWCWICRKICSYDSIYRHLSAAHGGFFTPDELEELDLY